MPGNQQQQPSRSGSFYQAMDSAECNASGTLKSATAAPGLATVSDSRLLGTSEIGVPAPVPFKSLHGPAPTESDVSIGPLFTGITMMVLMRRHRC